MIKTIKYLENIKIQGLMYDNPEVSKMYEEFIRESKYLKSLKFKEIELRKIEES